MRREEEEGLRRMAGFVSAAGWPSRHRPLAKKERRAWSCSSSVSSSPPASVSPPFVASSSSTSLRLGTPLFRFGSDRGWDRGLLDVCLSIKEGLYLLAGRVQTAGLTQTLGVASEGGSNASGDAQKELDVVSNEVMVNALLRCPHVAALASEEEDEVVVTKSKASEHPDSDRGSRREKYVVVFDPLDGSSNITACIPTGTIFGVYKETETKEVGDALQRGRELVLAGYCLYSSSTILVLSDGNGTHMFTLDRERGDFVLSHADVKIPSSGSSYSVNDGRYYDWPKGLQLYIDDIKRGQGRTQRKYDTRYICSLVADVHYVLIRGGIAMNPRDHLRLVYEGNPIAFIVENAGGRAITGTQNILDVRPEKLHHRLPLFVGSPKDIEELESYDSQGGIQQMVNPGYKY